MRTHKISSLDNPSIKLLCKINQEKYRKVFNKFNIESLSTIIDGIKEGYTPEDLYISENFIKKYPCEFSYLEKHLSLPHFNLITTRINKHCSQLSSPSGIIAIYNIQTSSLNNKGSVIFLNGINTPGNMGTILRTSLAFGINNIVTDTSCVDIYNSKVLTAARDAIFKLNFLKDTGKEWLQKQKDRLHIYVADAHGGDPLDKFEVKNKDKFCLIVGNETHGVDKSLIDLADNRLTIKLSSRMESLNVANATAIILYKLTQSS